MKTIERKIALPEGIEAAIDGKKVCVSAGAKKNERVFHAEEIDFQKSGNEIILRAETDTKKINAILNSVEAHLRNMVSGLQNDYEYKLSVVYSHFPITVTVKGNIVEITNFAGEKKPRKARIFGQTNVQVKGKEIFVKGHNKEDVGQTAAGIETAARVPKKDKRVFQDGIYLAGKN